MEAIKFKKQLNSDILNLTIPKKMIGKKAEIIVLIDVDDIGEKIAKTKKRTPGSAKGMITMSEDFEKPLEGEMLAEFYK